MLCCIHPRSSLDKAVKPLLRRGKYIYFRKEGKLFSHSNERFIKEVLITDHQDLEYLEKKNAKLT